jgi:hypothetical protein
MLTALRGCSLGAEVISIHDSVGQQHLRTVVVTSNLSLKALESPPRVDLVLEENTFQ